MNQLIKIYKNTLTKNYTNFQGRARRKEYWGFVLINTAVSFTITIISSLLGIDIRFTSLIYLLGVILPALAITCRRLHDIGKNGWWMLIVFIPILGGLAFIFLMLVPSNIGENKYGHPSESPSVIS